MMASHRPADQPPPPPPPESTQPQPVPSGLTTLPHSNFLLGFDWVLAFGVLALAFLIASFAVRNSDFWMHLATGRLISSGEYSFGTDPFSYSGGDRTWVNHAWLFDWLLYQVFRIGGGAGVVVAKALALAATAGLLLLARRPGQSVFPGVVCTGLAVVAAAPRLLVQPTAATFLFLAALMFLLIRAPRHPGSWRFPVTIALLFALWSNVDQWFFLGPGFLLLFVIGQSFGAEPGEDVATLVKALGLGILGCMLNPHYWVSGTLVLLGLSLAVYLGVLAAIQTWFPGFLKWGGKYAVRYLALAALAPQWVVMVREGVLPPELFDVNVADALGKDPDFAHLFRGALSPGSLDFAGERDNPANLYALLILVALGVVGFAVNRRQMSVGLGAIWLGGLILALVHLRAVPFFAFVAAPIAAANLAAAGRRLADTPMPDGTVRTLHALRGGGRAAVGLVGLLLIALTYPGWLHPFAQQRRWKWDVEPNPSLERAARKVHEWRAGGALPAEARLLNLHPDFASYLAWYAPGERSYFDDRLGFHHDEAAEYAALRRYLSVTDPRKRRDDPFDLRDFLTRYGVTFVVHAPGRSDSRAMLVTLWQGEDVGANPEWVLWDVQGRAAVFGWSRQRTIPSAAFDRLRFDPLRLAYADVQPLPAPKKDDLNPPPPVTADVWERFIAAPPAPPVDAEEAFIMQLYRKTLLDRATFRHQQTLGVIQYVTVTRFQTPALSFWTSVQANPNSGLVPVVFPAEARAVASLAVRAARRAVLASPDHPDGYYYLGTAYADIGFPAPADLQDVVSTVSLARARARVPDDPAQFRPGFEVADLGRSLVIAHDRSMPPRLDLALDATRLAAAYLRRDVEDREALVAALPADGRESAEAQLEDRRRYLGRLEQDLQAREAGLAGSLNRYLNDLQATTAALDRAAVARRYGRVQEAINELRKAHEQFQKQLQDDPNRQFPPAELAAHLAAHAELIEQLWYIGQVEEAIRILDTVDTPDGIALMDRPNVRQEYFRVRRQAMAILFRGARQVPSSPYDGDPVGHFRNLRRALSMIVGDFERAKDVQVEESRQVDRQLTEFRAKHFPTGKVPSQAELPDPTALQREMALKPVQAAVTWARMLQLGNAVQFRTLSAMRAEGRLAIALTYLEAGDVPAAVHYLELADDAPGWAEPIRAQRLARDLLKAIARARPEVKSREDARRAGGASP